MAIKKIPKTNSVPNPATGAPPPPEACARIGVKKSVSAAREQRIGARFMPAAWSKSYTGREVALEMGPCAHTHSQLDGARASRRLRLIQEWVAPMRGGNELLFQRARRHPAHQVPRAARFVIGRRRAAAAERLSSDDRAGRLVVDVEVARRAHEALRQIGDDFAILREDRAGERVRRAVIAILDRFIEA